MLRTTNITLDTSFFVAQNFLQGYLIREYAKNAVQGRLKLYITDITSREILNQFRKKLRATLESIKKPKALLLQKAMLLKNVPEADSYFTLPDLDENKLLSDF